ncbi:MAG: RNA helicase, partial [Verrucomicrobia bacterium]|nr:RNA helicase [Verrucomicrobiota bacterium]
ITRSRAWVAVCGWGSEFDTLLEEYEAVKEVKFTLSFKWPSVAALEQMRRLHRELSEEEKRARKTAERNAQDLMNLFASGRLEADDLDPELRENLKKWLK